MGDSKRRKDTLGDKYGTVAEEKLLFNFTRAQVTEFYDFVTKSTWFCIGAVVVLWLIMRLGVWQHWWGKG